MGERIVMQPFVDENDVKFPDDPMGRHGPKLDQFLSF